MSEEKQIILPDGFKRVEYLQSTGTQYINTNIKPNSETGTYVKGLWVGGGSGNNVDGAGNILMTAHIGNDNSAGYAYKGSWHSIGGFLTSDIFEGSLNYLGNKTAKLRTINKNFSESLPNVTFSTSNNLHLFNPSGYNYNGQWRIYSYKVTQGTEIILNFIPCLDENNIPCMYDLVSQKPFYNQGSGTFLTNKSYKWNYPFLNNSYNLPAGFKKCVYLQSDGTQYIDLDVYPNNETGLLIKAMAMGELNGCPMGSSYTPPYIYPPRKTSSGERRIAYAWSNWYNNYSVLLKWDKAGDLEYTSFVNYFNSRMVYFNSEDSDMLKPINSDILPQLKTNIRLFNWSDNSAMSSYPWIGRIYRAQITQGDILIHDYVPCLDANGRPCMYDLIESEALYNQSGGTEFAYCVEHQLPSDFVKLKYLEAYGTQYIKTGYVPTNTTGLYIDTQDVGGGDTIPMGVRESSSTNTRFFITRQTTSREAGYGWGTWTEISSTTGSARYDSTLNWLNDRKSITNNPLFSRVIRNLNNLSFTPTLDIWVFGINQGGSHAYKFKGRIYRARISEGSEIVRDFVPAYDELKLKPCMYDLINNVAYYNDGEGEFLTNRDFEGTYKGFGELGCIGNRLGGNTYN